MTVGEVTESKEDTRGCFRHWKDGKISRGSVVTGSSKERPYPSPREEWEDEGPDPLHPHPRLGTSPWETSLVRHPSEWARSRFHACCMSRSQRQKWSY